MKLAVFFLTMWMLGAFPTHAQDVPAKYSYLWNDGNIRSTKAAQRLAKKEARNNPGDPWPCWLMAKMLDPVEQRSESLAWFQKALEADSNFVPAHSDLGYRYSFDTAAYALAEYHYTRAIAFDTMNVYNYFGRGNIYLQQKRYDLAVSDAWAARRADPEYTWRADRLIVKSLYEQHKTAELKNFLETVPTVGQSSFDTEYKFLLGTIWESLGYPDKACEAYSDAKTDAELTLVEPPAGLSEKLLGCR